MPSAGNTPIAARGGRIDTLRVTFRSWYQGPRDRKHCTPEQQDLPDRFKTRIAYVRPTAVGPATAGGAEYGEPPGFPTARISPMAGSKPKRTRKGPTESATLFAVGTRKRGNDGGTWVVRATTAGIRRWRPEQRTAASADARTGVAPRQPRRGTTGATREPRIAAPRESTKKARTTRLPADPRKTDAPAGNGRHSILFCEPYSQTSAKALKRKKLSWLTGVKFEVGPAFYATLLRKPKSIRREGGNAYIFGPRFPLSQYAYVGKHGNDGAQTGFIDLDLFANGEQVLDVVLQEYMPKTKSRRGPGLAWDDRAALRRVRAQLPHILFIGETVGGDVGASLYAHRTHGKIDGLIIDNGLLFAK
jgi:hypothetical protein